MKVNKAHKVCKNTMKKTLLALSISIFATSVAASISLGEHANNKLVLTVENSAFVAGSGETPYLQQVHLLSETAAPLKLPEGTLLYDYGYWGEDKSIQAVALTPTGLYLVTDQAPQLLLSAQSLYSTMNTVEFKHHSFTVDSNNDGLTDIFLPGFNQQTLYQQQSDGSFTEHKINHLPKIKTRTNQDSLSVNFELPNRPEFIDINGDNILDVVFTNRQGVIYFTGSNSNKSIRYHESQQLNLPVKLDAKGSDMVERLTKLSDFNQDGIVDLFTKTTKNNVEISLTSPGGKKTIKVYPGKRVNGLLSFDAQPISEISLEGKSNIVDFPNLTGDKHAELAVVEVDIGITDIISIASAAASGESIELDAEIRFHRGMEQYRFSEDSEIEKDFEFKIKLDNDSPDFDLSMNIKDFNGDGKADLLLRTDDNELKIYHGDEKRLLSKRAKKIKHDLPENNSNILTQDINQDGKEDILIKLKDKNGIYHLKMIKS